MKTTKKCKNKKKILCLTEQVRTDLALLDLSEFLNTYNCTQREYWSAIRMCSLRELLLCLYDSAIHIVHERKSMPEDIFFDIYLRFRKRIILLTLIEMDCDEDECIYIDDNAVC